jgi:hypothetical protein
MMKCVIGRFRRVAEIMPSRDQMLVSMYDGGTHDMKMSLDYWYLLFDTIYSLRRDLGVMAFEVLEAYFTT